jgi:hypothetical protein
VFATPETSPATLTSAAPPPSQPAANVEAKKEAARPPSQPAANIEAKKENEAKKEINVEAKKEKLVATKSKRKPKTEFKSPARREFDDDDDTSVASRDSDDRASDNRINRRSERADRRPDRRRVVERWTERDYDVPASNGDGSRRVTVIRRGGGGSFETLFGN